nr:RNA-directed DNA polymerase, eukaryota, reverse transcriptase zinc-binding domain protein [Tanacetum cinerariifolium]
MGVNSKTLLDQEKNCRIVDRIVNGQWSWNWSCNTLGVSNIAYLNNLLLEISEIDINEATDKCVWSLAHDGAFSVAALRRRIDDQILPSLDIKTTWDKTIPCEALQAKHYIVVFQAKHYNNHKNLLFSTGEALYEYYWRFSQLINDVHTIGMTIQQVQVNTKFLNALLLKWSKIVTDVKLAKSLYSTNYDQLYAYISQHERHANDVRIMRERYPDPLELVANSQTLYNPFQSSEHSERLPILEIRQPFKMKESPFNKFKEDKLRVLLALETEKFLQPQGETIQLGIAEVQVAQQTITQNSAFQTKDLDAYDSDCNDISSAKAVLMANLSSCDPDVLSEGFFHRLPSFLVRKVCIVPLVESWSCCSISPSLERSTKLSAAIYTLGQAIYAFVRRVIRWSGKLYVVQAIYTLVRRVIRWSGELYVGQAIYTLGQAIYMLVRRVIHWPGDLYAWSGDLYVGQNPKDSLDPTTAMNITLALIAKAFKVNTIPRNNNQRNSLIPRNSQIAQSGMNTSQDIKMKMVDDNVGNQIVENINGLSVVLEIANQYRNRNVVTTPAEGNSNGINGNPIRCYNYRGEGHYASNCTVKPRKRDAAYLQQQLSIAQEEEAGIQGTQEEIKFMASAYAYEETERVKVNCTSNDTLRQASTSGTQYDNAPVYDSDGSTEVPKDENCYDHDMFNMLTHEVQYTDLQTKLDPTKEKLENCIIKKEKEYDVLWNNWYTKCEEYKYDKILVNNSAKTRRPHLISNSNTYRVPSKSKSSCLSNSLEKIEENHRNLQSSSNQKLSVNHDVCVLNYVNDMNSHVDNQSANVSIREDQKKHKENDKKSEELGSKGSLASSRPTKPRTYLRWISTGRIFAMCGKLTAFNNTKNKSEKYVCDNESTSNPSKPSSKGFSNSASLLGRSMAYVHFRASSVLQIKGKCTPQCALP